MKRLLLVLACACGSGPTRTAPVAGTPAVTAAPDAAPAPTGPGTATAGPPRAAIRPVTDTLHGVAVHDPYRWLEGEDAEVKRWSAAQNVHARQVLDGLPGVGVLRGEIAAIVRAPVTLHDSVQPAGARLLALRRSPDKEQAELIVFDAPDGAAEARLVLDPAAGGAAHRTIDWYVPSPDGTRVAVSLSDSGSEQGDLHVVDLDGRDVEPVIPNVQRGTGGGSVAWTPDGKGFFYTRYPAAGEQPEDERSFWMQVHFHALGSPITADRYELGKGLPKIAEIRLASDRRGRVLAKVQNGDGGEFRHYLRDPRGRWRQLGDWKDGVIYMGFGTTDDLWMISNQGAPRGKVLRLPAAARSITEATVVIPEGKDAIVTDFYDEDWGVVDAGPHLLVTYQVGGPMQLRAFTRAGAPTPTPTLPPVVASNKPVVLGDGTALVRVSSYTAPPGFHRVRLATGAAAPVPALSPRSPVDLSSVEIVREFATSKDGTRVPFTVLWPGGSKRDGTTPCLVTGYGGYSVSESPRHAAGQAPLLARGVCVVWTNLRGGGEFGEAWHQAGMLTHKQNVFDDFAAVLSWLVDNKYTRPDRLAIIGGSNGGLLMGAIVTQHPTLVRVVVSSVGIYDSVRAEQSANGAYNVPEFGTVADPAQFAALHAYSPYHHVAPTRYPAILMMTGDNDARVPPWHSRKFTAALQAAQTGDAPILLRTSSSAGHGAGTSTSERIDENAHAFAFVLWQLGLPAPAATPPR
ncbi:MAG: S9 family peptidase [Kofleriaceae bacterium]|nr:S9 family peptidase [Kofleriaceae bacterium]